MLKIIDDSWDDFEDMIANQISQESTVKVLEIGGGANPLLSDLQVSKHKIKYTVLDIDQGELDKSRSILNKSICHDICDAPLSERFDLIFSRMVLEHIENPSDFHRNILQMMHKDSLVYHFYATKYGLPSLLNLLLPAALTDYVVYKMQRRDPSSEGKFKAYYRKCTGPLKKTKNWFENVGFNIEEYRGYIGHGYLGKYKILGKIERSFSSFMLKLNSPLFTSNAILVMKLKDSTKLTLS